MKLTFLKQTFENFTSTGAIAPSSSFLARAIAEPLKNRRGNLPLRILEAGPGTGALTKEICKHLREGDELVLCEINEKFVAHLQGLLDTDPNLSEKKHLIKIFHGPVEQYGATDHFDFVISGLPFNNFKPETVYQIFSSILRSVKPGGTISFFEYVGVRKIKKPFLMGAKKRDFKETELLLKSYAKSCRRKLAILNLPPAWACHITVDNTLKVAS